MKLHKTISVVAVVLFLLFDLTALVLNVWLTQKIEQRAVAINLAGRQRMLSQRLTKVLLQLQEASRAGQPGAAQVAELREVSQLFDDTLRGFVMGHETGAGDGGTVFLPPVTDPEAGRIVGEASQVWAGFMARVQAVLTPAADVRAALPAAVAYANAHNLELLDQMNQLTSRLQTLTQQEARTIRTFQAGAFFLALVNFLLAFILYSNRSRRADRLEQLVELRTGELEETNQRLRDTHVAMDKVGIGIHGVDAATGRFLYINRSAAAMLGYSPEEMLKLAVPDVDVRVPHDKFAELAAPVRERGSAHFESVQKAKDGHEIPVEVVIYYQAGTHAGDPGRFISFVWDITELRQAREQIQRQADELNDLYNKAPCGYHSLAEDGTIVGINDTELGWLGQSREEVVGKRLITEFMTPASIETFKTAFPRLLADGAVGELELKLVRRDGTPFPVLVSATALRDADGRFLMTRSALVDYSRLWQQRETMRKVLSAAPVAVCIAALSDNRVLFMNAALCRLAQCDEDDIVDMDIGRSYVDPAAFADIRLQLDRGETVFNRLTELCRPDQPDAPHAWVLGSYTVIDYEGQPAMLAWLYDVTELHQARAAAEAATLAKSSFLANMSHEIRTPMNAILGLAYLLERSNLPDEATSLVTKIRTSGRVLLAIINDILDFSKIESGNLEIETAPFHLNEVLDRLSAVMSANASNKDIELIISSPNGVDNLLGDALRLEQVLINLTGNAIKFTEHGHVELYVSAVGEDADKVKLRFAVIDTGIGIPADKQAEIFGAFNQGDASTTRRFGGSGLGLAISRQLVEMMGGELAVKSTPGAGSEFWFTLEFPRVREAGLSAPEMAGLELLVADDNPAALEALGNCAQAIGWSVTKVDSGEAAVQQVLGRRVNGAPDQVVVLDWKMPGIDGLAAARAIRAGHAGGPGQPILVMVTAYAQEALLAEKDSNLVDAVLTKPVTPSSLYDAVALSMRRQRGEQAQRPEPGSKRLPGLAVLVVDDSDINREVAQRIFSAEGAKVVLANDGQQAVDWLAAHPEAVDVVLMDVQMPVMDGYEATRRIRANPALARLPVVALTAGAFKSQQDEAREAGMDDFIAKPFDVDAAVHRIQKLTGWRAGPIALTGAAATTAKGATLPGLDIERGLRLWRDAQVYRQYLHRFARDHGDSARELRNLDATAAAAQAHKLKGTAANLALVDVARCASEVDACAQAGGDLAEALDRLQGALDVALASIRNYAPSSGPDAGPAMAFDRQAVEALLTRALAAFDSDNPAMVEPVLAELAEQLPGGRLDGLRRAVEAFDFRGGEAATVALAAELGVPIHA